MARFSVELQDFFFSDERGDRITLVDILELAGERTFGFLLVLLALPSALPVPAPGYSAPFGVVIFLLAVQLIAGRTEPWFPKWFRNRSLSLSQVQAFIKAAVPWLKRLENVSRPRMSYLCTSRPGQIILGCAIALMGISMMIIIPGTNTLPAIGVFVIGFSLIEDDGFISIMGLTICLIAAALTTAIIIGGKELIEVLIDRIRGLNP
ncbi:MAG: exopolysaccharide biosynthesis protein [Cyanobacteria bacterium P01_A01_bin.37]